MEGPDRPSGPPGRRLGLHRGRARPLKGAAPPFPRQHVLLLVSLLLPPTPVARQTGREGRISLLPGDGWLLHRRSLALSFGAGTTIPRIPGQDAGVGFWELWFHLPPSGEPQAGDMGGGRNTEIDRRLEKKLKITQKESRKSKSPPKVPIVIQDDSLPPGPPPQIRILKRPTSNGVLSNPNSTSRPAFPVKSLAQREAEYAEARKRILGSASPEEEEQDKPILDRPTRISQPEEARPACNVIRQPLGPDGSHGFKQRR